MKSMVCALVALCLMAGPALAYEIVAVEDGGSLSGTITTKAAASNAKTIAVTKDEGTCHATVPDESCLVGEKGGLANAIVYFVEVEAGKDPATMPDPMLQNKECRYVPHAQAMMVGQPLVITNEDPVLHNTHTYDGTGEKTVFNLALPIQGQKIKKKMKRVGLVNAKCDAGHTWMNGYVWVNQNPYYAVTDAAGNFEITDVPEGDYTVKVWHATLGESEHEVTIDAGSAASLTTVMGK